MNIGLILSLTVHVALLGWALLTIQRVQPLKIDEPTPIAISIMTPAEFQLIAKGERNAKNLTAEGSDGTAKKDPPKLVKTPPPPPKEAVTAPPPPPPPEPKAEPVKEAALVEPPPPPTPPPAAKEEPPPPPGPSEEEKRKLEEAILQDQAKAAEEAVRKKAAADAKAKADAEAKAKAEAERKRLAELERLKKLAEQKKLADEARKKAAAAELAAKTKAEADAKAKQFDPNDILAKIEKAPNQDSGPKQALEDKAKPKPALAAGTKNPNAAKGPRAGDATGTAAISQGEANQLVAAMRDQLSRCWNINSGHPDAARMQPKFEFELNRDGSLRGEPVLVNPDPSPGFQDAANAARRALRCASPFRDLPADKYEHWERAGFTFDPSKMFR